MKVFFRKRNPTFKRHACTFVSVGVQHAWEKLVPAILTELISHDDLIFVQLTFQVQGVLPFELSCNISVWFLCHHLAHIIALCTANPELFTLGQILGAPLTPLKMNLHIKFALQVSTLFWKAF